MMVVGMNIAKTYRRQRARNDRTKATIKFERMRKPKDYKSFIKYLDALADCQMDIHGEAGGAEELGVLRTIRIIENYRHLFKGEKPKKKGKGE